MSWERKEAILGKKGERGVGDAEYKKRTVCERDFMLGREKALESPKYLMRVGENTQPKKTRKRSIARWRTAFLSE